VSCYGGRHEWRRKRFSNRKRLILWGANGTRAAVEAKQAVWMVHYALTHALAEWLAASFIERDSLLYPSAAIVPRKSGDLSEPPALFGGALAFTAPTYWSVPS
jgi:hypothetical protein